VEFQPVFIIGCWRSGTTFLYSCLTELLPVAKITPHVILYYNRLLTSHLMENTVKREKDNLNAYFKANGCLDRAADIVRVSADSPEELAMLLGRLYKPRWVWKQSGVEEMLRYTIADNPDKTRQICQKLVVTQKPAKGIVLIKNPLDYGSEATILKHFPNAKFIHITRDPLQVINSTLGIFGTWVRMNPLSFYYWVCFPEWYRFAFCVFKLDQAIQGDYQWGNFMLHTSLVALNIKMLSLGTRGVSSLPVDRVCHVSYEELMQDPIEHLASISSFIGLPCLPGKLQQLAMSVSPRKEKFLPPIQDNLSYIKEQFAESSNRTIEELNAFFFLKFFVNFASYQCKRFLMPTLAYLAISTCYQLCYY